MAGIAFRLAGNAGRGGPTPKHFGEGNVEMGEATFAASVDVALVGEIDARRELAAEGWLTFNTNTEKGNFPNVDLMAAKGEQARALQVKTTDAEKGSHKHCLYIGRAEGWLTSRKPFFNSKAGPLQASVVVLVHAKRVKSRFVVLPVAVAELIARHCTEGHYAAPKLDGQQRSAGFDARPPFTRLGKNPRQWDEAVQAVLLSYESRWDVLDAPVAELHSLGAWGINLSAMVG